MVRPWHRSMPECEEDEGVTQAGWRAKEGRKDGLSKKRRGKAKGGDWQVKYNIFSRLYP